MMAGLITNGYFLVPKRIEELNDAGARLPADQHRQHRARRSVEEEPARARQEAAAPAGSTPTFDVNINSVLGGGIKNPEDARTINKRARELGFSTSIGIIHDGSGRLKPLGAGRTQGVRRGVGRHQRAVAGLQESLFGDHEASRTTWPTASRTSGAAAPARATSISARTASSTTARSSAGYPGVPLESYTIDDIRREFATPKSCAPYCTVGCVHRVSTMDFWRSP